MFFRHLLLAGAAVLLGACSPAVVKQDQATVRDQVMAAERAFAKAMADRNLQDFAAFVSEEAIFFSGPVPLRGKAPVVSWWARYFSGAQAPFSWEPDEVEVLDSETLALSSGPVRDPSGKTVSRFLSIWRQEAPGTWRVIFDKGCPLPAASR